MKSKGWLLVACVCLFASIATPAAVPTQDTMVVARSDETGSTTIKEEVTEEPTLPLKLTEMDVKSEVSMRYANTAVVTRVRNPAKKAQEATFRVLLPETAFISGFTMILDGKSYKAYVKEKEEAKKIYEDAVSQGIGAAHIATKARDSNHFTVSVNVEPDTTAVFNLTYEELLVRRNGVYNHAINLHPGTLVPKLTVTVHIKETQKITNLRVPEVRTGNEVDATKDDKQNSNAVIDKTKSDHEAIVTFAPDLQEQKRLMEIYAEKSKESSSRVQGYRPYYYEVQKEEVPEGVLGQFVVQYDVDHSKEGEILVNDGYFVHFFAPSDLPPLNKHVVFVLDTSGSMMDRKIVQLRDAMRTILTELNPGDYFNIVEFSSDVQIHDLSEADREESPHTSRYTYDSRPSPPPTPVAPAPATPQNIEKAKIIVSRLPASGGTNIGDALDVAVDIIQRGLEPQPKEADKATNNTTVVKPDNNTHKQESKILEPIIIFLTDGEPTVGETSPKRLINRITEKNYGDKKASIFTLAFGEDADREFLRKVSLRNAGFMRHIYEAADAALQLQDFYRQVASPLLAHVKFTYPKEQVKQSSVTKSKFRTYYLGSEMVVAGELEDLATTLEPQVIYKCRATDHGYFMEEHKIYPRVPIEVKREQYLPLERLWAYLTIKQLLDEKDSQDDNAEQTNETSPEKKALAIALKYEFVTPLTSLVVVKPNATKAVDAESVDTSNDRSSSQISALSSGRPQYSSAFLPSSGPGLPMAPTQNFGIAGVPGLADHAAFDVAQQSPLFESEDESDVPDKRYEDGTQQHVYSQKGGTQQHTFSANSAIANFDLMRSTTFSPQAPIAASEPNTLASYHLEQFPWAQSLVDLAAEQIAIPLNGTTLTFKLTKGNAPRVATGDAACARAVGTESAGVCVYLTRCAAAQNITTQNYIDVYHCQVADSYAGVCCEKQSVDV